MAMGLKGEVWSGSQWNNEALGVGEVTQGESKEGGGGPKGTKTFKGHAGEEALLQREGKERQNKEQSEVSQQIWHTASDDAEGQDGNRPENVRGILQQDVCIGSVAGGLRGVLGTDMEVREWGWRHVSQEAWF